MAARRFAPIAALALAAVAACSSSSLLPRLTLAPSPHERYAEALRDNALIGTALARDWLEAADTAMARPLEVALPMRESGYFAADRPSAVAYQFQLQRGRRLSVEISFDSVDAAQLFVDLFEIRAEAAPRRIASLAEGATLTADVPRDGSYVLRVQPELLRSGRYTIVQRTLASLPFPVDGLTARAVQSEFGAARDAGRREHEGIDIFAARNTPVLAVADGTAQADTNPLGGNVVWLRDRGEARSFYYAHLTRAAFEGTLPVRAGDVVGYIGNTGNARTTPPHLHFGIYQRGAVDPLPFLRADDPTPAPIPDRDRWLAHHVRVTSRQSAVRTGTGREAAAVAELYRGEIARVVGVTQPRLRVELPDGVSGYLDRSTVTPANTPLRRQRLASGAILRDQPLPHAPAVRIVDAPETVDVVGEFNGFALVKLESAIGGWLAPAAPAPEAPMAPMAPKAP